MTTQEPNWQEISKQLAKRVKFAISYCDCKGHGLYNNESGKITPWRDYMVEALEMIPGIVVDREMLATLSLPKAKQRKAQSEIKSRRAKSQE